jgi:hypothetical protein
MCSALPFNGMVSHEPQKRLVNKSGGLECVVGALSPHAFLRTGVQIAVNQRSEVRLSLRIALPQRRQQICDFPASRQRLLLVEFGLL